MVEADLGRIGKWVDIGMYFSKKKFLKRNITAARKFLYLCVVTVQNDRFHYSSFIFSDLIYPHCLLSSSFQIVFILLSCLVLFCKMTCDVLLEADTWQSMQCLERIYMEPHRQWEDTLALLTPCNTVLADSCCFHRLVLICQSSEVSTRLSCCYLFMFVVCYWTGLLISWQRSLESPPNNYF